MTNVSDTGRPLSGNPFKAGELTGSPLADDWPALNRNGERIPRRLRREYFK